MIAYSKKILLLFFGSILLLSCGSDVDPGKIEGAPRTSEAIYKQDLKFLKTKDSLFGDEIRDTTQILFGDLTSTQWIPSVRTSTLQLVTPRQELLASAVVPPRNDLEPARGRTVRGAECYGLELISSF